MAPRHSRRKFLEGNALNAWLQLDDSCALGASDGCRRRTTLDGQDFFSDEMEPQNSRRSTFLEVTAHGVSDAIVQLLDGRGFREDRLPKGARRKSALGSLLDEEDDLGHSAKV